jgi:hypothetical protein
VLWAASIEGAAIEAANSNIITPVLWAASIEAVPLVVKVSDL